MRLKKWILAIVAVAMGLFAFAGCDQKQTEDVKIDVAALADSLKSQLSFDDTDLVEMSKEKTLDFYQIDAEKIADLKVYMSSATTEEIAVFEAKEEADVEGIEKAVQKRIEDQKSTYEDYAPDEVARLDSAYTETRGKYVVFVVAKDNSSAEKIVASAFEPAA